jgi:hypothetical protein
MKSLLAFASVVAFSVAPAFAGQGQVSDQSLAKMGLSGMKAISDAQGMQIRGLSIAVVSGGSGAHLPGAGAGSSFFAAGSGPGYHSAEGSSSSSATDSLKVGFFSVSITASSKTSASASAH